MKNDLISGIQKTIKPYLIQQSNLLPGLPVNELQHLKNQSKQEKGKRGSVLFRQGGFPKSVIWLISGKIKIYQESPSGQRQTVYVYTNGDLIGYRQLIAEVPNPVTAVLLEDSEYMIIPAEIFLGLLKESLLFTRNVLTALAREFTIWMNRTTVFTQFPVRHRLILALLILNEQYRLSGFKDNEITMTRTELAEYVGASLETVVRALNKLKSQNLVKIQGRTIRLLDVGGLLEIVNR